MNSSKKLICSFNHDIYTVNVTKVSLSAYDDKRYTICDDGITSYAYGNFRIAEQQQQQEDLIVQLWFSDTTLSESFVNLLLWVRQILISQ